LPTPRTGAVAAAMTGRIYVIGGRIGSAFANGSDVDVVEAYDPSADRWTAPLARLPAPRGDAAVAVWRNLILLAGGTPMSEAGDSTRALIGFDPSANRWSTLPAPPLLRTGFAAGVIGDRFYAVGGEADRTAGAGLGQPVAEAAPAQRGSDARNGTTASTLVQAFELLAKPAEPGNPAVSAPAQ
jgi:N-acetylneuraminic acid mutarotase